MLNKKTTKLIGTSAIALSLIAIPWMSSVSASTTGISRFQNQVVLKNGKVKEVKEILVGTYDELVQALQDNTVTDISLTANITLSANVVANCDYKVIHGNGYTLDANKYNLKLGWAGSWGKIENLKIINTDIYGIFWGDADGVEVTYHNVSHSGSQLIYLPYGTLNMEGEISSTSSLEEGFQGKEINIEDGAKVNITTEGNLAPISFVGAGKLTVGDSSTLQLTNTGVSPDIYGSGSKVIDNGNLILESDNAANVFLGAGSQVHVNKGGVLKALSKSSVYGSIKLLDYSSLLTESGSTLTAESAGVEPTIFTGNKLNIVDGAKFSITNHNTEGPALGGYGESSVSIDSSNGISTWNRGSVDSVQPKFVYGGKFTAQFKLTGIDKNVLQKNLVSNNINFQQNFNDGNTGKIVSSDEKKIIAPVINVVYDTDQFLTGTGIAGYQIEMKTADGKRLGSTIVDSDGRWKFKLSNPLVSGTEVIVDQTDGSFISNSVSTTVMHKSSSTTNDFSLGYWQNYGLLLEGQIDNIDWDLTSKDSNSKTIYLVDSTDKVVEAVKAANTNWYGNETQFDGYQGILTNETLSGLSDGSYKVKVGITIGDKVNELQDLHEQVNGELKTDYPTPYRKKFENIDSQDINGKKVSTEVKGGKCYIVISTNK